MKRNRLFFTGTIAVAVMALVSALPAAERDGQQMSINLWGSGLTSVRGHFNPTAKTLDVVENGPSLGLSWQYFPLRSVGVQVGYELGWMNFEKRYRSEAGKTPAFVVHQITLAGLYNFSELVGSNARVRPLVSAGVGLYPFRITEDGITGEAQMLPNGHRFQKSSLGLNAGAGVEVLATNRASVFGGARYHLLFSRDNDRFGAESNFGDQGLLSFGIGLSYHFPIGM